MLKTKEALIKNHFLKFNSRFLFDSNQCFHIFSRFLAENCEKRIPQQSCVSLFAR